MMTSYSCPASCSNLALGAPRHVESRTFMSAPQQWLQIKKVAQQKPAAGPRSVALHKLLLQVRRTIRVMVRVSILGWFSVQLGSMTRIKKISPVPLSHPHLHGCPAREEA